MLCRTAQCTAPWRHQPLKQPLQDGGWWPFCPVANSAHCGSNRGGGGSGAQWRGSQSGKVRRRRSETAKFGLEAAALGAVGAAMARFGVVTTTVAAAPSLNNADGSAPRGAKRVADGEWQHQHHCRVSWSHTSSKLLSSRPCSAAAWHTVKAFLPCGARPSLCSQASCFDSTFCSANIKKVQESSWQRRESTCKSKSGCLVGVP